MGLHGFNCALEAHEDCAKSWEFTEYPHLVQLREEEAIREELRAEGVKVPEHHSD